MLKYIFLGYIFLVSTVLCAYHGQCCSQTDCTTGQKVCDSVNRTKLLGCGSNFIYCGIPFGSTYWKVHKICGHCCETLKSNGPYCVPNKEACDRDRANQFF